MGRHGWEDEESASEALDAINEFLEIEGLEEDVLGARTFVDGLVAMREMQARFLEQGGHPEIAQSIRLNWNPSWGADPGQLENAGTSKEVPT